MHKKEIFERMRVKVVVAKALALYSLSVLPGIIFSLLCTKNLAFFSLTQASWLTTPQKKKSGKGTGKVVTTVRVHFTLMPSSMCNYS